MQTLDDDPADRGLEEPFLRRDPHTAQGAADLEHVGCENEGFDVPRCYDDGVGAAVGEFVDFGDYVWCFFEVDEVCCADGFDEFAFLVTTIYADDYGALCEGVLDLFVSVRSVSRVIASSLCSTLLTSQMAETATSPNHHYIIARFDVCILRSLDSRSVNLPKVAIKNILVSLSDLICC